MRNHKFSPVLFPGILIFAYACGYFVFSQYPSFTNDYLISDDTGMHSIWMGKYIGENNFRDKDILVEVSQQIQPMGFYFVHRLLSVVMSPVLYTKLIPFLIFFINCYVVFLLLNREFGWKIATVGLIMMSNFLIEGTIGFHARSFAYLSMFSFLYLYLGNRYKATAIIAVLTSLIYPSSLLRICTMVGIYHLLSLVINWRLDLDKTQLISLGTAFVICGVIMLTKSHSIESHFMIGETYSMAEMRQMEELGTNGRVKILPQLAPVLSMSWNYLTHAFFPKLFLLVALAYLVPIHKP